MGLTIINLWFTLPTTTLKIEKDIYQNNSKVLVLFWRNSNVSNKWVWDAVSNPKIFANALIFTLPQTSQNLHYTSTQKKGLDVLTHPNALEHVYKLFVGVDCDYGKSVLHLLYLLLSPDVRKLKVRFTQECNFLISWYLLRY